MLVTLFYAYVWNFSEKNVILCSTWNHPTFFGWSEIEEGDNKLNVLLNLFSPTCSKNHMYSEESYWICWAKRNVCKNRCFYLGTKRRCLRYYNCYFLQPIVPYYTLPLGSPIHLGSTRWVGTWFTYQIVLFFFFFANRSLIWIENCHSFFFFVCVGLGVVPFSSEFKARWLPFPYQ